jgi:hypothetical protein
MTVVTVGRMSLLLLMFTLTIPGPSDATVFFDDDFAAGSLASNGWNQSYNNPPTSGSLEISTDFALTGTHSVKGYFTDVTGMTNYKSDVYKTFPSSTHVFMRYGFRESPGFVTGTNGGSKRIRYTGIGGNPNIWTYTFNGAAFSGQGQYSITVEAPYDGSGVHEVVTVGSRNSERDNIVLFSGVNPSQTSWDQVETEVLFNDPGQYNGVIRMWINGTLRIEVINVALRGPTPTSQCLQFSGTLCPSTVYFNSADIFIQSGLGQIYYDRIAVGDTRIGTTTGGGGDIIAPAAPLGLQVR